RKGQATVLAGGEQVLCGRDLPRGVRHWVDVCHSRLAEGFRSDWHRWLDAVCELDCDGFERGDPPDAVRQYSFVCRLAGAGRSSRDGGDDLWPRNLGALRT